MSNKVKLKTDLSSIQDKNWKLAWTEYVYLEMHGKIEGFIKLHIYGEDRVSGKVINQTR